MGEGRKVRGILYVTALSYLSTKYRQILPTVKERALKRGISAMKEKININDWYDYDEFIEFMGIVVDALGANPEELMRELGRFSSKYVISGMSPMLFTYGDPMSIIARATELWGMYYSWGSVTTYPMDENTLVLEIKGCDIDKLIVERICGWVEETLTTVGCLGVNVSYEKTDEICKITATWTGIKEI